jgi:hypothetical protein
MKSLYIILRSLLKIAIFCGIMYPIYLFLSHDPIDLSSVKTTC